MISRDIFAFVNVEQCFNSRAIESHDHLTVNNDHRYPTLAGKINHLSGGNRILTHIDRVIGDIVLCKPCLQIITVHTLFGGVYHNLGNSHTPT